MVDGDVNQGFCRLDQGVVGWEHMFVSEGRVGASGNVVGGREPSCVCVRVHVICVLYVCVSICYMYICMYVCMYVCAVRVCGTCACVT